MIAAEQLADSTQSAPRGTENSTEKFKGFARKGAFFRRTDSIQTIKIFKRKARIVSNWRSARLKGHHSPSKTRKEGAVA